MGLRWITVMTIFKKDDVVARVAMFRSPLAKLFNYYTVGAPHMNYNAFHTFLVDFEVSEGAVSCVFARLFLCVCVCT